MNHKYKKEFKGALREIRKDMHFLAQEMSDVKKRCVTTAPIGPLFYIHRAVPEDTAAFVIYVNLDRLLASSLSGFFLGGVDFVCFSMKIFTRENIHTAVCLF